MLKIEIDGHFHGGEPVKPWVAEITGLDPKWGLARRFLDAHNDWSQASSSMRGRIYGRVAHFALRDGRLYEVQRCTGNSSKRRVVREFLAVAGVKRSRLAPLEALARVDGGGPAATLSLPEDRDGTSWVALITRLGTPDRLGFVGDGSDRRYRLRDGLYEVVERDQRRFVGVRDCAISKLSSKEALAWLTNAAA